MKTTINMAKELEGLLDDNGKLPAYAWPGEYPLYYIDADNLVLCPACANKTGYDTAIVAYDVNYDDTDLCCDDCSQRILSAYCEEIQRKPRS